MFKVRFTEYERGWTPITYTVDYSTEHEAQQEVRKNNDKYLWKGPTPDFYVVAEYLGKD